MEQTYRLNLTPLQVEVLLDTTRGFVDNKKLLHVPTANGELAGLPLTEAALSWLLDRYREANEEKGEVLVTLCSADVKNTAVTITYSSQQKTLAYDVNLAEFDEQ
ncbi:MULTISPECIES: hypothetical protein [Aneurinibacillus]|uniref:Uncharacterized protein n=1 Tax=Aneurinibacillus thermoaerophilus TaxID=143495 RepID=A0A1G8CQA4_ANETH|nr:MULTISPECIES: hypothetical protein [Aneurinibacillus]AMA71848.1 hypothetical protein ACH33_02665 [Aneurinibacillus sp. XH2]MED0677215.1 hypothetical protein [Aneurinibacillus thermoaerophilus]MED0680477.1 hypothetical protein [Aneurinibacillus thermoaerophilus]MED0737263.1 hypothetical protein [Aneurinibacillus thermoaerophilus]MED0757922.1 hypothetical protein [Aneurinibacillus thermoaerophilus]